MSTLKTRLTEIVTDAFTAAGYDASLGVVTFSDRPDLAQFQCNGALTGAKLHRKAPMMIANDVVARLSENEIFKSVTVAPPGFINIILSDEFIAGEAGAMTESDRLALPLMEKKTIVVDYGGPNVAKPLHVGHLRAAIIGETLKRLARFLGHNVIGDVHLGDWGLQMGLIIAELERVSPDLPYFDANITDDYPEESPVTIDDLSKLYPEASARSKTDEEFRARAMRATFDLQNGRPGYVALWKKFLEVSVSDLKKSYARLGVDFDKWLGESDADPYVPELLKTLDEKNLTYLSDGALIADVAEETDDEPMPPVIISKSDGSALYATTDLATIVQRMRDFEPNEIWYVVDSRQSMHFKQVFRLAKKAGLVNEDTALYHVGFGTMNGSDGKPYKTREGGVMSLSVLIQSAMDASRERIDASEIAKTLSEEEKLANSEKIGIAAIKFGDLINHRSRDYIFDLNRFLSTEGKTGPYLQYTVVRISSLLAKASEQGAKCGKILPPTSDTERELLIKLFSVGDVLLRAFDEKAPSAICEVMFDIAGLFNRFYFENKILSNENEEERASWLSIVSLVRATLLTLLDIFSTEIPSIM
ncbi:MAG: arginine--tRNA ligase [Oscillospiraceae bacterium]|nr:arginine--tRNA ligase [Oscillospiraceae bacterium]